MIKVTYEPQAGDYLECENGAHCCWQQWDGVESLAERDDRHALTVLSKPPKPEPEIRVVMPYHHHLFRAIWEADEEVRAFVHRVSDFHALGMVDDARYRAAMDLAFERRDPPGSFERCNRLANNIGAELAQVVRRASQPGGGADHG